MLVNAEEQLKWPENAGVDEAAHQCKYREKGREGQVEGGLELERERETV